VRDYVPEFRMYDPVATERMTSRDLVTHRSGLPRHDLIWYGTTYTRQELFSRLRYLEPSKDFRAVYQYQNLMFMAAGVVVEHVSGCTWEEFVRQRILQPLGMRNSNFSVTVSQKMEDVALPYHEKDDALNEVPFHNLDAVAPAGAINSTVNEMVHWLRLHLDNGKHGEQQLISETTLGEMHSLQMVMPPAGPEDKEIGFSSYIYGLGWWMNTYRGHLFSQHAGGIDGFSSLVTMLPREKIGVVVLTNRDNNPLPTILTNHILDHLLGLEPIDLNKRLKEQEAKRKQAEKESKAKAADAERKPGAPPSHPLPDYAGTYEHPGYGPFTIRVADDALEAKYGVYTVTMKHVHYDTFEVIFELNEITQRLTFALDLDGNVSSISAPLEGGAVTVVFTRVADKSMSTKDALEKFVGAYEVMGITATVALRGENTLVLTVPGQPPYELVPSGDTRFSLKGLQGYHIAFTCDDAGRVVGAVFQQPNGEFSAKRK
jgi:CubicO group peptidase (beta-lactamase class C family)